MQTALMVGLSLVSGPGGGGRADPQISGDTEVGSLLTLDPGGWAGAVVQWYRADPLTVGGDPITVNGSPLFVNLEPIPGQTGLTYTLAEIDIGMVILCGLDDGESTIYTDSLGPVTDARYGPELLLNPRMDAATDWIDNDQGTGVSTFAGGLLTLVCDGTTPTFANRAELQQQWTAEIGATYRVRVDVVGGVAAVWGRSVVFDNGGTQATTERVYSAPESYAVDYVALTATPRLFLRGYSGTACALIVTSASVRKVL